MSASVVTQKTVSRKILMSCGHEQRIRLQRPKDIFTTPKFEEWAEEAFVARRSEPCPTCGAEIQAAQLDHDEIELLGERGRSLNQFVEDPIAVATFARQVRFNYLSAMTARFEDPEDDPLNISAVVAVLRAWMAPPAMTDVQVTTRTKELLQRYLSERAGRFQSRYWITKGSKKVSMVSLAAKDASNPQWVFPALVVALAGFETSEESYRVFLSMFRVGTPSDFDLSVAGRDAGLPLHEVLERVMVMAALAPDPWV